MVTNAVERPRTANVGQPFARRVARLLLAAVAALPLVLSIPARAGADTPPPTFNPPKQYYLSLGESFAFGLQIDRLVEMLDTGTYTPDAFNTGFTDVFAALMRQIRPDLQVVNYSCPGGGGDTVRFITDGCFFTDIGLDLHNNFVGSQLDAAVRFLRDHPGRVSPVTISTGDDDIFDAVYNCNADPTCLANSGLAQRLSNNLGHILSALRSAAPDAEIIMYLPHNLLEVDVPAATRPSDRTWMKCARSRQPTAFALSTASRQSPRPDDPAS